jgi:hypothetical protein
MEKDKKNDSSKDQAIPGQRLTADDVNTGLPGYPLYPASDDIYARAEHQGKKNHESISGIDNSVEDFGELNEKGFEEDETGEDLDVPGSDLDDMQEDVGSEDEENNYYSIGGDEHNDLEEDNADRQ